MTGSRDNYEFFATLSPGGGGGAPTNASYVVIALNGTLTAERVLTAGAGISITDGGAGGNVTIAATGGGGVNVGTATINFGSFPGSSHATVAVTGQAGIVAGSVVQAWIRPVATADHSADEHIVETLRVVASDIVAGTGFTINVINSSEKTSPRGEGTRIYGAWTVAWSWA